MRVGLIIGQLTYGGAESQLYELARGLGPEFEPTVYCLSASRSPYGDRLRDLGIPLRVLPARGRLDVTRVARLARALAEDRIELAHAFLFIASAYGYLATRFGAGVDSLVTSARNCKLEPSTVRRAVIRRAFRASDAIICNSSEMAAFAHENYDAPVARTRVVLNGVDIVRFSPGELNSGAPVVGTVGRIEPQKNLDLFLEGARKVLQTHPETIFEIVGEGSLRSHYEARVAALGLSESVFFKGTMADIPGFLARLNQFWLTSDWEGTPNVVLEAMAAGVPVVATRVGGTPEVVADGVTGSLIEAGDVESLAVAAGEILGDPMVRASMSREARDAAERRFSLSAMVAATEAVYREAAADRR